MSSFKLLIVFLSALTTFADQNIFFNGKLLDVAGIENQFIASNVRKSDKLKKKIQNKISPQISLYNQNREALKCEFTNNIWTPLVHSFDFIAFQIRGEKTYKKITFF